MTTVDTFEKQYSLNSDEHNTVYLIKENKQVESTSMSLLVEQYNKDLISEDKFGDILLESIEYEYQQLMNEGVLDTLKKVAGKVGGVANKALAQAQFKAREVFFRLIYGTASKIIKFVVSLSQKAMKYLNNYIAQVSKFKDNPPKPNVAQKMIALGVKVAKAVGSIFEKVASFMLKVIKPIVSFLGHPVVKNTILVGCVIMTGVALAAPGAIAGTSMAFLIPFATRRSGFEAGKAAVGMGKYNLNKDNKYNFGKDKVNEETDIAFASTEALQEIFSATKLDTIGVAMDDIAEKIGSTPLDKNVEITTIQNVVGNPDGSEIVNLTQETFVQYSDENLKAQYAALEMLKNAGEGGKPSMVFESAKDLELWERRAVDIVKRALESADSHCEMDNAACVGAKAFIKDINIANTAVIQSEFVDVTKQTVTDAKVAYTELTADQTTTDQRFAVTRGGEEGLEKFYKSGKDLPPGYEEVPDREPEVRSRRRGIEN